jgi:hypothetical protein
MIPYQHTEEVLSVSYVKAVVSQFGHTYSTIESDYGTDGCVRKIKKTDQSFIDLGTKFDCQLKASINWEKKENYIVYDLSSEAYNKLVLRNNESDIPCLLIILCLPKEKNEWLSISENALNIRNCCYFTYLYGTTTKNVGTKRIFIPMKNIFDINNLDLLFNDFEKAVQDEQ